MSYKVKSILQGETQNNYKEYWEIKCFSTEQKYTGFEKYCLNSEAGAKNLSYNSDSDAGSLLWIWVTNSESNIVISIQLLHVVSG